MSYPQPPSSKKHLYLKKLSRQTRPSHREYKKMMPNEAVMKKYYKFVF